MIENLKQIYTQGFPEDGEKYAEYFCNKNAKYSVFYPQINPVSAGYILDKKLSNGDSCAYFSALATKENERGKGNASALIKKSLIKASEQYPFAVLSPFNSNFYKKYGFFTTQFYKKDVIDGNIILAEKVPSDDDLEDINSLFNFVVRPLIDKAYLSNLIEETKIYGAKPLLLKQADKTVGFCVKEETSLSRVLTKDIVITSVANFNGYSYKRQEENGEAFIQVRILSLDKFVKFLIPKKDFAVGICVEDDVILQNNGCFIFESINNSIKIKKIKQDNFQKVKIENLISYLYHNNLIEKFQTQFIDEY